MKTELINNYIFSALPARFPLRNTTRFLNDGEIAELQTAEQFFSDCYLTSGLDALTRTDNGRLILKNNIIKNDKNQNIITYSLYSPYGGKDNFTIDLKHTDKKFDKLKLGQSNKTIQGADLSIIEFEKKYNTKPWYCKLFSVFKTYKFENYIPSRFLKMMTGKEPITVAEKDLNIDLTDYKTEVINLLDKMSKNKNYSFIIMNGLKKLNGRRFHVYVIEDVNMKEKTITIKNKRGNIHQTMPIDTAIKTFKSITGYFNEDLAA